MRKVKDFGRARPDLNWRPPDPSPVLYSGISNESTFLLSYGRKIKTYLRHVLRVEAISFTSAARFVTLSDVLAEFSAIFSISSPILSAASTRVSRGARRKIIGSSSSSSLRRAR